MNEMVHGEVTAVAAATSSKDPEVALAAVAALQGLVEVLGPSMSSTPAGIDLDAVQQRTEQAFGPGAVQQATREATRARRRGSARVPRTPLDGPPLLIGRTLHFAAERRTRSAR